MTKLEGGRQYGDDAVYWMKNMTTTAFAKWTRNELLYAGRSSFGPEIRNLLEAVDQAPGVPNVFPFAIITTKRFQCFCMKLRC